MQKNNSDTSTLFKISFVSYYFTFPLMVFFGLWVLGDIVSIIRNSDILINTSEYTKKYVLIDSLYFLNRKGIDSGNIYGYSKEVNDYKTEIIIGSYSPERTVSEVLGERDEERNGYYKYIWYKKNAKYAYVTDENEKAFPVSNFVERKTGTILFIVILFIINRISRIIVKKVKLKEEENEKKQN